MMALMYDGLELGTFKENEETGKLELNLHDGISTDWLPYIFSLGFLHETDMNKIIEQWKKERVFPKNRINSFYMLLKMGMFRYDIDKIAKLTRCSIISDPYWIAYEDDDTYHKCSVRGMIGENIFPYNSIGIDDDDEDKYKWRI